MALYDSRIVVTKVVWDRKYSGMCNEVDDFLMLWHIDQKQKYNITLKLSLDTTPERGLRPQPESVSSAP